MLVSLRLAAIHLLFSFVTNNFLWRKRQKSMRAAGVRVIRNHDFRHTVASAIYRTGMKRGDPEIVAKIARMMGHKKLAQTSPTTTWKV